jgi:hypothetical protein
MLRQANHQAVLRTRLVVVIVPVAAPAPAPAPPAVHHIIIAVTHTNIQQAQAVQLDSKTVLILNHNTKTLQYFFICIKRKAVKANLVREFAHI